MHAVRTQGARSGCDDVNVRGRCVCRRVALRTLVGEVMRVRKTFCANLRSIPVPRNPQRAWQTRI